MREKIIKNATLANISLARKVIGELRKEHDQS